MTTEPTLLAEITHLLNSHSRENASGTPDFILAEYLIGCLEVFEKTTRDRDLWWGFKPEVGGVLFVNADPA